MSIVGRIAIGRIERGVIRQNEEIAVCNYHEPDAPAKKAKAVSMYEFEGLQRVPVTEADGRQHHRHVRHRRHHHRRHDLRAELRRADRSS